MGAGIAQVAAAAGHPVILHDTRPEAIEKAIGNIRKTFRMLADKGRMTEDAAVAASARLQAATHLAELADARLVVEAIVENQEVKRGLFADLEDVVSEDCILATNTSSISITALNRPDELKLHVRGAINNGLTKEEIKEVFKEMGI